MYGLAELPMLSSSVVTGAAAVDAGPQNCGWWSLPGSRCWQLAHPGEDTSLLCRLGITACVAPPPLLRSAGAPPPIDDAGRAPDTWTIDDQVAAAYEQNRGRLEDFWNGLPGTPPEPPKTDYTTIALVVAGVALTLMLGGR